MTGVPLILSVGTTDGRMSDPGWARRLVALAEAARIDLLLLGDGARAPFDPLVTAAWLAPRAQRVALVPTIATGRDLPFHVARALSALDFLTGGGCAWQPSSTAFPLNGEDGARGADFVAASRSLWDSWDQDALIVDQASGIYLDDRKVRRNAYHGRFFRVLGPLNAARPPQGHPPLVVDARDPACDILAPDLVITDRLAPTGGAQLLLRSTIGTIDWGHVAAMHSAGAIAGLHLTLADPLVELESFAVAAPAEIPRRGTGTTNDTRRTLRERLGLRAAPHRFQPETAG